MKNTPLYLLLLFVYFFLPNVNAQTLLESRRSSYETQIYKLNDKQALRLYSNIYRNLSDDYFEKLVVSYPSDSTYNLDQLSFGHYIIVKVSGNQFSTQLFSINNLDARVLDNSQDLMFHLYNSKGQRVEKLKVKSFGRSVRYDKKIAAYRMKKSNKKGLIKIHYEGHTNFIDIERKMNNTLPAKVGRYIVYSLPVRMVRNSYRYVRSIIRNGYFYKPPIVSRFENLFSDKNRSYKGYIVSQQPKYKPGDTVRVKAFIMDHKKRPITQELELVLTKNYNQVVKLGKISPYSPGAYHGEIVLHDSLKLKLDTSYPISFRNDKKKDLQQLYFRFEEYELKSFNYSVTSTNSQHWPGKSNTLKLKGTDSNGLFIPDANYELFVFPSNVKAHHATKSFLADTLWQKKGQLDPRKETEIPLPDSIFGSYSLDYRVKVIFLDASNERHEKFTNATFLWPDKRWELKVEKDSVFIDFQQNNESSSANGELWVYDDDEGIMHHEAITSPFQLKLMPYHARIKVKNESAEGNMDIASQADGIAVNGYRTKDSLYIDIQNPRNIPLQYFIYFGRNKEIKRGHGHTLALARKSKKRELYHLSVQYVWGGKAQNKDFSIPYREKEMSLNWLLPEKVYPGQEVDVEIQAIDVDGNPLENVDLTAYGLTKKFDNYAPPSLEYYGKSYKGRKFHNTFESEARDWRTNSRNLDWQKWNKHFGLDSITYYQFIYPKNNLVQKEIPANKAQFAPFVYQKGRSVGVWAIYVNRELVYFSNSNHRLFYSFPLNIYATNYVEIYAGEKVFVMEKLKGIEDKKLLLSIDYDRYNSRTLSKRELKKEKNAILNQSLYVKREGGNHLSDFIIEQNNHIYLVDNAYSYYATPLLIGPVKYGPAKISSRKGFEMDFNFEPHYDYTFRPGLLKMTSRNKQAFYPNKNTSHSFSDSLLGKSAVLKIWEEKNYWEKETARRYITPNYTKSGNGRLKWSYNEYEIAKTEKIRAVFLFNQQNPQDINVHGPSISVLHDVFPGSYRLIVLFHSGKYLEASDIDIKANGETYHLIKNSSLREEDSFSKKLQKNLENTPSYINESSSFSIVDYSKRDLAISYGGNYNYSPPTNFTIPITGRIVDNSDNEPLPGVSIHVKGTNYGVVSDMDGFFKIFVPNNETKIIVSFIGYKTEELDFQTANGIIAIRPDIKQLSEIVVVGYGVSEKKSLTASVSTVSSLQGRAAGVAVVGSSPNIRIRGASSLNESDNPLYIIDGVLVENGDFGDFSQYYAVEVLKGEAATAIYGSRAARGVVIISTNKDQHAKVQAQIAQVNAEIDGEAQDMVSSLRSNFRDYAFWQPALKTDKEGKAQFKVQFPDDITGWRLFALGIGPRKHTAVSESFTQSYKPLLAQLLHPRFLVSGDSSLILGKSTNYSNDTFEVKRHFALGSDRIDQETVSLSTVQIDSLWMRAGNTTDSLEVLYQLEIPNYFDGEKKKIPVFPQGIIENKGNFWLLEKDSIITVQLDTAIQDGVLYFESDLFGKLQREADKLIKYQYQCNEQLASKLLGYLVKKDIATFRNEPWKQDKEIESLIRKLVNNQNEDGSWAWFNKGSGSLWISIHVHEMLLKAKEKGYTANFNEEAFSNFILRIFENTENQFLKSTALKIIGKYTDRINLPGYVQQFDSIFQKSQPSLVERIQWEELKLKLGLDYNIDWLENMQKESFIGSIYFGTDQAVFFDNDIQTTLAAYRIIREIDSADYRLSKMRNYFMEKSNDRGWRNTYESANILLTIIPDLIKEKGVYRENRVRFTQGERTENLAKFPHEIKITSAEPLEIQKQGNMPLYFTAYQRFWNPQPEAVSGDFKVKSYFEQNPETLSAGKPINLVVEVEVKKYGEYVMVEIPIPAGCSYGEKSKGYGSNEVHREYFLEKVSIFCSSLRPGKHTFMVALVPRYSGNYHINPAKAELMYFPIFFGREEMKKIQIK